MRRPRLGSSGLFERKMAQPDGSIYLSRHLMRLFGEQLSPMRASMLAGHMYACACLMERRVTYLWLRGVHQHPPAQVEPPWEVDEQLLRTWPELLLVGEFCDL